MDIVGVLLIMAVVVALGFMGIGVCIGRYDKQNNDDSGNDCNTDSRNGDRSDDTGTDRTLKAEEVIRRLLYIKTDLSKADKEYIDYAIKNIQCVQSVKAWIDERSAK